MNFIGREKTIQYLYYVMLHYIYICVYMHMCTSYSLIYLQNSFKLYGKDPENRERQRYCWYEQQTFESPSILTRTILEKNLERKSKLLCFLKIKK